MHRSVRSGNMTRTGITFMAGDGIVGGKLCRVCMRTGDPLARLESKMASLFPLGTALTVRAMQNRISKSCWECGNNVGRAPSVTTSFLPRSDTDLE